MVVHKSSDLPVIPTDHISTRKPLHAKNVLSTTSVSHLDHEWRTYFWLRAMIDELPYELLAVFKRPTKYGFGVSSEIEGLSSVRTHLD
jgi:hypothetical protein